MQVDSTLTTEKALEFQQKFNADVEEAKKNGATLRPVNKKESSLIPEDQRKKEGEKLLAALREEQRPFKITAENGEVLKGKAPKGFYYNDGKIYYQQKVTSPPQEVLPQFMIPSAYFQDIENQTYKTELLFYDLDGKEKRLLREDSELSESRKLPSLSNHGLRIDDINKKLVLLYLREFKTTNDLDVPVKKTISHLGWTSDFKHFVPYSSEYFSNAEEQNEDVTKALKKKGSMEKSLDLINALLEFKSTNHLLIVIALSSLLVKYFYVGSQMVHLHGASSESGKTTLYEAIASMMGDPSHYVIAMNATEPAKREVISYLCNFPLIMDEEELMKDEQKKGDVIQSIYFLTEGRPKRIAQQNGNIKNNHKTWQTIIMTNGESELLPENAKRGSRNRVIEIELDEGEILLFPEEKGNVKQIAHENYGHIFPDFVEFITPKLTKDKEKLRKKFSGYYKLYSQMYTNRHSDFASLVMVTGELFSEYMKTKGREVTPFSSGELEKYLKTKKDVDTDTMALKSLSDSLMENINNFPSADTDPEDIPQRLWGVSDSEYIYILPSVYNRLMDNNGFYNNKKTLLKMLKRKNLLRLSGSSKGYQVQKKSKLFDPEGKQPKLKWMYAISRMAIE